MIFYCRNYPGKVTVIFYANIAAFSMIDPKSSKLIDSLRGKIKLENIPVTSRRRLRIIFCLFFILVDWFTDHFMTDLIICAEIFSFITFYSYQNIFLTKFWSHRHSHCSPQKIKSLTKLDEDNLKVTSLINRFNSHHFSF